jgi:hypothetical protein
MFSAFLFRIVLTISLLAYQMPYRHYWLTTNSVGKADPLFAFIGQQSSVPRQSRS